MFVGNNFFSKCMWCKIVYFTERNCSAISEFYFLENFLWLFFFSFEYLNIAEYVLGYRFLYTAEEVKKFQKFAATVFVCTLTLHHFGDVTSLSLSLVHHINDYAAIACPL